MRDGFIKVAAITPEIKVADVDYNSEIICSYMKKAEQEGAKISVFPELCITGYTCQDLFWQDRLLESAKNGLLNIAAYSKGLEGIYFVGLPLSINSKLYNVSAAISQGKILGIVPKIYLPNYNEFYEGRHFASGKHLNTSVEIGNQKVSVSSKLIFKCQEMPSLKIAVELCEDLWVPNPPSISHALAGATVIVNLSASDEITGKSLYRRELVSGQSARLICGYIYASAGNGESTQDVVYSGHNIIAENGKILRESELFTTGITCSELDLQHIEADRRRMTTFDNNIEDEYAWISFHLQETETKLSRYIDPMPFVPSRADYRNRRCNEILMIQAMGLKKRLEHIGCGKAVIGISGGLDSTLALLVTVRAFDLLGLDRKGIVAVTMPGFGTTDRTYDNGVKLIRCLGADFREISIVNAVNSHFSDIGHDPSIHDVTYENCQARERTQILMDLANKTGGIVIGTGDLSELALGWATYNGDHMSMYAVNASIPKTLVRHLVKYYADTCGDKTLAETLHDILATPVSPELLPPEKGEISQKTEDLVGPYELHDFFLYHMLRRGSSPLKIFRLARHAFKDKYDATFILKWEKIFYKRFFTQHFKRSCLPDGPKVGTVAVSPRGDLRMPTDACASIWLKELEAISEKEYI
ncbi:MAG: NAD(+) synthase [Clostridiales bacterium]|nr:NAD(+) synthase [Clostridiales bacterium]